MPDKTSERLKILLLAQIQTTAAKTTLSLSQLIAQMKAAGMSNKLIKKVLLDDLESGGRLFGQFRNNIKSMVTGAVGMAGGTASRATFNASGVHEYRWVTAGINSCPDCIPRHGEVGTMEFFEAIGLPKSGFSVCQSNCQCALVPIAYKGENLDKPLKRDKKLRA